jgi:adenosylhomocysteine nucleosidase
MLLFVAADRMEFTGILRHAGEVAPVKLPVDWCRRVKFGSHDVLLATNGIGAKRAAAAVDIITDQFRPDAIISTGFCGALDPALGIADVVVGTSVTDGTSTIESQLPASDRAAHQGRIHTAARVIQTAEEKAALRNTGAIAVEMEAAAVATRAAALRVPFYCVKSVTDLSGETLTNDFNAALRPDGHFDTMLLVRKMLRRPIDRLPELVRLRNRCARAARVLGDFFVDCRF